MRFTVIPLISLLALAGAASAQELDFNQKQAVDRQERNLKEAQGKLKALQDGYAAEWEKLKAPETMVPPAWFKGNMAKGDEVLKKCDGMVSDLEKSKCPPDNARVKAITDWVTQARADVAKLNAEMAPKLAEMETLANPKNYPNLDADFKQIDTVAKAYAFKGFQSNPDKVAELAKEFAQAVTWGNEKFKEYRPIMVLSGGKSSPLFKKYEAMSNAIKGFQTEAGEYFKKAEAEVPALLKKAEEMAAKAAAEKKPAFFTGGVQQQFDWAENYMKVCRALVPADDERLVKMESAWAASKKKVDEQAGTLKELIVAETRPPDEKYSGADKEEIRAKVMEEWKKAWPKDEVMMIRMHMANFDRREKATWDSGSKSWEFSDRSVLCVTVIVKTSDKIATSYPAYVNVNHISKATTYGVGTKGNEYVTREMLVENVK
ncbi:MAG: hypothetical protein AAB074_12090 [Planctomycetota bacterium]